MQNCFICGSETSQKCISNQYYYYICSHCNTSQLIPQPNKDILKKFYDNFHLSDQEGGSYDWIEDRIKADFPKKIKQIKYFTNSSKIILLDVGCGKGFFIESCNKNKINAEGIDVSKSGIDHAVNTLSVKAEQFNVVDFSKRLENKGKYDVITLWATIEHLPNPAEVFNAINICLKPGGYLFLDTGLGNDRFEKLLSGHSQWYDAPQHLFVFSVQGLKILLRKTGFKIINVDTNFERSDLRCLIKFTRHFIICFASFLLLRPLLGISGFKSMQQVSKWPIGKLLQIIAKKT